MPRGLDARIARRWKFREGRPIHLDRDPSYWGELEMTFWSDEPPFAGVGLGVAADPLWSDEPPLAGDGLGVAADPFWSDEPPFAGVGLGVAADPLWSDEPPLAGR